MLGKLYSTTSLGIYTMGVFLAQTPSVFITNMMVQTLLPAFAHVQDDKARVNRILIEVTSWTILLGLPAAVACYLCGGAALRLIYGTRYVEAAGPLAVAAVVVLLSLLNVLITCVFSAMGRPGLHRPAVAASAIVMAIAIYPACKMFGPIGGQLGRLACNSCQLRLSSESHARPNGSEFADVWKVVSAGDYSLPQVHLPSDFVARFAGFAAGPIATIALAAGLCVVAYAVCVPAFLKIRQTAKTLANPVVISFIKQMTTNPLMSESRNLDFLRASAVLLVLVDHLFMAAGLAERYPVAWDMGRLGVLMFFVHTSLVLMFSLERSEARKPGNLFRDFYIRRAFRIYPLSIVFVLLACIFAMPETPGGAPAAHSGSQIAANLLLVQNICGTQERDQPAVEPAARSADVHRSTVLIRLRKKRYGAKGILKVACAAALIGLPYDWMVSTHPMRGLDRLNIFYFIPCFLAGIMCYCLSKKRTLGIRAWLWPVALGAIIAIYLLWTTLLPNAANRYPAYRAWFVCWMLGLLIPQFQEMRLGWLRAASHYVAKYSYGIYLGQVAALWIGFTFWPSTNIASKSIVSVLLLAGIAIASFHAIENPGIQLGKLVADRTDSKSSRLAVSAGA